MVTEPRLQRQPGWVLTLPPQSSGHCPPFPKPSFLVWQKCLQSQWKLREVLCVTCPLLLPAQKGARVVGAVKHTQVTVWGTGQGRAELRHVEGSWYREASREAGAEGGARRPREERRVWSGCQCHCQEALPGAFQKPSGPTHRPVLLGGRVSWPCFRGSLPLGNPRVCVSLLLLTSHLASGRDSMCI